MKMRHYMVGVLLGALLLAAATRSAAPVAADQAKPSAERLAELKKQRLKTAQQVSNNNLMAFEAATVSMSQLIGTMRQVFNAERALVSSPREELDVLEGYVQRLNKLYSKVCPPREDNSGKRNTYPELRLEIETAEINALEFRLEKKI